MNPEELDRSYAKAVELYRLKCGKVAPAPDRQASTYAEEGNSWVLRDAAGRELGTYQRAP